MNFPDPVGLKHKILSTSIISSSFQLQGKRDRQEDFVISDSQDTFVIADGIGGLLHGDVAGKLAAESAVWAVNLAKQRFAYWKDKKLLGGRIMRSVNWTLYNKRRETGFEEGMGSVLTVLLFGEKQFYVYSVGDVRAYLYRDTIVKLLTPIDRDSRGYLVHALGIDKKAPESFFYKDFLLPNDIFVIATDGVGDYVSETEMQEILQQTGETKESLTEIAKQLVMQSQKRGSTDNMTVCIVKNLMTGSF